MNIFHRYIIREHIAPFIFAFTTIMFVLLLKRMLELIDMLISKDVGIIVISKLLVFNLAWMVALVVPMSVLVATVMAFGRMGASSEITAMKAAGISMYSIVSPMIFLSILLTIFMIWFNNNVLPESNHRARSLNSAILMKKPMLSLKNREGQFISDSDLPFTFRVDEVDNETEEMIGITMINDKDRDFQTIIIAEKGVFIPGSDNLTLLLTNGEIHQRYINQTNRYIRSTFDGFKYVIKDLNFGLDTKMESSRNDRTMTSEMMRERINELKKKIDSWEQRRQKIIENDSASTNQIKSLEEQIKAWKHQIAAYLVEIHKKNSIPVAAIIFVLIGASLGMLIRRSGASIGIGLSIGFFMLYYMFLIGGESAGDRILIEPWLAMWLPNIFLGAAGIGLFIYAARR